MGDKEQVFLDDASEEDLEYSPLWSHRDFRTPRPLKTAGLTNALMFATSSILMIILIVMLSMNLHIQRPQADAKATWGIQKPFGFNLSYMSLDHDFDYLWDFDLSSTHAIVELPPFDSSGKSLTPYPGAYSMFHQLHCLARIRKALQDAREGKDIGVDNDDDAHWPHCFYTLRQALDCFADDTVELPRFKNGSIGGEHINGAVALHTCRDSSKLYRARAEHEYRQDSGE